MNSLLSKFLEAPNVSDIRGSYLLKRLDVPFTVSAMTDDQFSEYQKRCTKRVGTGAKAVLNSTVDFNKLKTVIVAAHVVEPNIRDTKFLKDGGWQTAEDFIAAKLTPGEVLDIYKVINEISGFDATMDEEVEDAKN